MKRFFAVLLGISLFAASPVYAAESSAFSVTVGMEKETDATFDDCRTFSGTGEVGDIVTINVYTENAKGKQSLKATYEMELGASGLFSQSVSLYLGKNVITISNGEDSQEISVRRYKQELKEELETGISIPGSCSVSISAV